MPGPVFDVASSTRRAAPAASGACDRNADEESGTAYDDANSAWGPSGDWGGGTSQR
ncbi:hypothetical protein [Streptomyces sp. NPDC051776]|uniref:hypothetical protein n=1 Tax=Streptomyces sp. NPDC051776 TaxID=3155414 RepID=UPI0034294FFB